MHLPSDWQITREKQRRNRPENTGKPEADREHQAFNAALTRGSAHTFLHTLASPSRTEPEMLLRNAYVFLKECALRQTGPTSLGLGSYGGAAARPFRPGTAQDNLSATCSADSYTEPSLAGKRDV